ncbi:MAG: hypothetical protein HONBIEJF_01336 [Fimbriimonadaceae bacterium]|nr:hypothetical protein [Fimbriimonadaceae bacterium]
MNCNNVNAKLSAYLDGEVCGTEMMMIRSHLQYCDSCRQELEEMRNIKLLLGALPGAEPNDTLVDRLKGRIALESGTATRPVWWARPLFWAPAAAAVAIGIFAVTRQSQPAPTTAPMDPTNHMDRIVVETSPRFNAEFDQVMQASADPIGGSSPIITVNHGGQ